MSSPQSKNVPGWYWPDDVPGAANPQPEPQSQSSAPPDATPKAGQGAPHSSRPRRTYWPPRQCRICLDTVNPTTQPLSESLPGFLQSTPNVTYEDENGRLIRPCLCKGSSKYVHEGCLQAWRHADPSYGRRNYWQCPTCGFKYRLARMGMGRWVASKSTQVTMTIVILFVSVFLLGFVADPIINMYLDPWSYLMPWADSSFSYFEDDEPVTWSEHFAKGFAGMGVIGFLKVLVASPFTYFRFGGRGRRGATGRDRAEQISWLIILIGVMTFLTAIWKGVRAYSRRMLEKAGERVMDVQPEDDDDDDEAADQRAAG